MSFRTFCFLAAGAALPFGLGFSIAPVFVAGIFGVTLDVNGVLMARYFGALLITVGLWFFLLRDTQDTTTMRAMVAGHFIGLVIGFLNVLNAVLTGTMNSLGWLVVLIYGGLAAGAAYLLLARPAARPVRART